MPKRTQTVGAISEDYSVDLQYVSEIPLYLPTSNRATTVNVYQPDALIQLSSLLKHIDGNYTPRTAFNLLASTPVGSTGSTVAELIRDQANTEATIAYAATGRGTAKFDLWLSPKYAGAFLDALTENNEIVNAFLAWSSVAFAMTVYGNSKTPAALVPVSSAMVLANDSTKKVVELSATAEYKWSSGVQSSGRPFVTIVEIISALLRTQPNHSDLTFDHSLDPNTCPQIAAYDKHVASSITPMQNYLMVIGLYEQRLLDTLKEWQDDLDRADYWHILANSHQSDRPCIFTKREIASRKSKYPYKILESNDGWLRAYPFHFTMTDGIQTTIFSDDTFRTELCEILAEVDEELRCDDVTVPHLRARDVSSRTAINAGNTARYPRYWMSDIDESQRQLAEAIKANVGALPYAQRLALSGS